MSPAVEEKLGMVPTPQEQAELDRKLKINISSVEK